MYFHMQKTSKRKPKAATVPARLPIIKRFLDICAKTTESSATPSREGKKIHSKLRKVEKRASECKNYDEVKK